MRYSCVFFFQKENLMANSIEVTPVKNFWDRRAFLQLPWRIYANDSNWIPPLLCSHLGLIGFKKDAYYLRNQIQTFLARRNGKVVGRIAAIVNQGHLDLYQDSRGFFGFLNAKTIRKPPMRSSIQHAPGSAKKGSRIFGDQ